VLLSGGVVVQQASAATPTESWAVGQCFETADVGKDLLDTRTAVPCAQRHAVQVVGGVALPASLADYSYAQLTDQSNKQLRAQLLEISDDACSGRSTAAAIWPRGGRAIADALIGSAASTSGGILPPMPGIASGFVFPDQATFDAGDRSLVCIIYMPIEKPGAANPATGTLTGNVRDLSTSRTLPQLRTCYRVSADNTKFPEVSCAKPHSEELLAFLAARLPANYDKMTAAQWRPLDRECTQVSAALVGAKRSDLRAYVNAPAETKAGRPVYLTCYVQVAGASDNPTLMLPAGTVVGKGTRPLT
jgi:hypothetical protein